MSKKKNTDIGPTKFKRCDRMIQRWFFLSELNADFWLINLRVEDYSFYCYELIVDVLFSLVIVVGLSQDISSD